MHFNYVSKMSYNKDKDLVFVTKPDRFWGESEHIYEVHHLEEMVPAPVLAMKNMSSMREDGLMSVYCMATKESMKFYKDPKYWNTDLRPEFFAEIRSLWGDTHYDRN